MRSLHRRKGGTGGYYNNKIKNPDLQEKSR